MRNLLWIVGLVFLPVGALLAVWHSMKDTDWPAWLQAIGSIWAVGIAIWLSHRADSEQQQNASKAVLALASVLDLRLFDHAGLCRDDSEWELMRSRLIFDQMNHAARSIRVDLLPADQVYHYLMLLNQLTEASFLSHRAAATGAARADLAVHFDQLRERVGSVIGYFSLTLDPPTRLKTWVAKRLGRRRSF